MNDQYMHMAIVEAKKSTEPLRCGTVIVRDNELLAAAHNSQRQDNDATAHAEIKALQIAGQKVGSKNINGADVYCTCEPCPMCLAALSFAKVKTVIYGASLNKVSPVQKNVAIPASEFLDYCPNKFQLVNNFMEEECETELYKSVPK